VTPMVDGAADPRLRHQKTAGLVTRPVLWIASGAVER